MTRLGFGFGERLDGAYTIAQIIHLALETMMFSPVITVFVLVPAFWVGWKALGTGWAGWVVAIFAPAMVVGGVALLPVWRDSGSEYDLPRPVALIFAAAAALHGAVAWLTLRLLRPEALGMR